MNAPGYPFVKVFHYSPYDSLNHVTVCCTWEELWGLTNYLKENNLYIGEQRIGNW